LASWRAQLEPLRETRRQALKRYDIGHDDAMPEADTALAELERLETAIVRGERRLSEYPARMDSLNKEIEITSYRERCKELLTLQSAERDAWHDVEALLVDFYTAWFAFEQARIERKSLAKSLANMAGQHGLTSPGDGGFPAPTSFDLQKWFEARPATALEQIENAVRKAAGR
jgi:predicted  nucleic acid-binding Zn-ribbon protein